MGPTDPEIREALGHLAQTVDAHIKSGMHDESVVRVTPEDLQIAVTILTDRLGVTHLSAITGEDLGGRLRVMYHFWRGRGVTLETELAADAATVASIVDLVPGATLYEREVHGMLGVVFEGHPDPQPLLLPDGWAGPPPLRKEATGG